MAISAAGRSSDLRTKGATWPSRRVRYNTAMASRVGNPQPFVRLQRRGRFGITPIFPVRRKTQMSFSGHQLHYIQFRMFRISVNAEQRRQT